MPLFTVSADDMPDTDTASISPRGKTSNTDFIDGPVRAPLVSSTNSENLPAPKSLEAAATAAAMGCHQPVLSGAPAITSDLPPSSSPVALTEPGSSSPASSPNCTPSKPTSTSKTSAPDAISSAIHPPIMASTTSATGAAATKKRKLTAAEKEAERAEKKRKQEAAAEEKAQKQAEKQRAAQEKEAEKARKQRERDEAKAAKEAEKAKVEAERNAKKREKEEKEKAAQKNNQKQRSLMDGFVVKKSTEDETKPAKPEKIYYDTKFQPFFVHPTVTVAPAPFAMDDETKTIKSKILDEYIRGERGDFEPKPFDPQKTFDFAFPIRRGRVQPSVQNIMSHVHENDGEIRLGLSSPMPQADTEKATVDAQKKLNGITMKYLRFWEDVRPAYCGTITNHVTTKKLYKLSRQPAGRIMPLAYDYESEAEWEEDDGEDVDGPEDDEDPDEDEEMDDFVDDSEAAPTTIARPGFLADCEPKSTGICFEDRKRVGPSTTPYKYRLEFLLDTLEHHSYIDPFSGEYWASAPKKAANSNSENSNSTAPLPAGSRTVSGESAGLSTKDVKDAKDLVPDQVMPAFKQALLSKELKVFSKAVVVEMLAHKFDSVTKAQVKATVDTIAHRVTVPGEKKSIKHWALLPAFAS